MSQVEASSSVGSGLRFVRVKPSVEGLAGVAGLRERLAQRPRDETLSVKQRREAINAFTAVSVHATPVVHFELGGVHVERHDPPGAAADRVLVYAHGGAFVIGSAATHRVPAAAVAAAAGITLYSVSYRLAPECPFPAGRDDLVAVCLALSEQGLDVSLVGDSAGGGLVLQAALVLRDLGIGTPSSIAVTSPWIDLSLSGASYNTQRNQEALLTPEGLALDAERYLSGRNATDPAASPLFADLSGLPSVLIQVGEDEILLDDAIGLAQALAEAGVPTEIQIWEGMIHAWYAFRDVIPEADSAVQRLGKFLANPSIGAR